MSPPSARWPATRPSSRPSPTRVFRYLDVQGLTTQAAEALALPPRLADQLQAFAVPIANGVQSFTRDQVGKIVQSQAFADAWVQANRAALAELVKALTGEGTGAVTVQGDTVSVNLAAFIQTVKAQLLASGFTLAERIPEVQASFVLFQSKDITCARSAFRLGHSAARASAISHALGRWGRLRPATMIQASLTSARRTASGSARGHRFETSHTHQPDLPPNSPCDACCRQVVGRHGQSQSLGEGTVAGRRRRSCGVRFADRVPRHRARRRRTLSAMATWPTTTDEFIRLQQALGEMTLERWQPPTTLLRIGACFVCFERAHRTGAAGDRGFAAAAVTHRRRPLAGVAVSGPAGGPYLPTLLALREGPLLEQAVRALEIVPEVLVVNATGRDHPRRAGLALQLGAVLGLPTLGVTTRPLVAQGAWPADQRGATTPLLAGGEVVGCWVRTRAGAKPVVVHAAWQTDAQDAVQIVLAATRRARTPEPLRRARTLARTRRARGLAG